MLNNAAGHARSTHEIIIGYRGNTGKGLEFIKSVVTVSSELLEKLNVVGEYKRSEIIRQSFLLSQTEGKNIPAEI